MSKFLELANMFESIGSTDDQCAGEYVRLGFVTVAERDMIVAALRGADALRALTELPPRVGPVGGPLHPSK